MSEPLPKEQQSAYQRWEMASFGDERASTRAAVATVSEEELEAIREAARQQGFAQGMAQGHAAGLDIGRVDSAQEMLHLQQIAEAFGGEIARANEVIADEMLDLGLDLAKAMLKTALEVRPELVLPVVAEAIRYLPSLQQPALLFLHPEDARLARDFIGDELAKAGWRVSEDINLERGGCRVETPTNQIDGSIQTRWQRIAAALGKNTDWLA
ncbi:MAG: flagellar assembly protein FliH [Herminiimonas sp.]|nr:flagellar assembly protein FliH [Herminiimonas sp.]